ncbi:MAG: AI-2E family transporter [Gemmatimonadota bacterium]|jgi:predicted PurR-regulated permease PerM
MTNQEIWSVTRSVATLLVLAFFLFALRAELSPVILYLVLLALLLPRGDAVSSRTLLLWVTTGLAVVWVLLTAGTILAPFLVALALAYLLDPLVDRLQARGLGRTPAIALLVGPVVVLLAVGLTVGPPALERQVGELIDATPEALDRVVTWAQGAEDELARVPVIGPEIQARLSGIDSTEITDLVQSRLDDLARRMWSWFLGVGRGLSSLVSFLGYTVLTPVLAFYLLRDWDALLRHLGELVPPRRRGPVFDFLKEYDRLLGRYLRGQITVALLMGLLTALGLWAWGFPYSFLVGGLVALFSVVPYLGLAMSLVPAVIIALLSGTVAYSLVKVAVVFAVVQGLEGTVISPRIVGDSVGLHPVWIVLAITAGGFFFGFVGLLLAVPVAAGLKILLRRAGERYRASRVYLGSEEGDPA